MFPQFLDELDVVLGIANLFLFRILNILKLIDKSNHIYDFLIEDPFDSHCYSYCFGHYIGIA